MEVLVDKRSKGFTPRFFIGVASFMRDANSADRTRAGQSDLIFVSFFEVERFREVDFEGFGFTWRKGNKTMVTNGSTILHNSAVVSEIRAGGQVFDLESPLSIEHQRGITVQKKNGRFERVLKSDRDNRRMDFSP